MRRLGKRALTVIAFLATLALPASAQTASPVSLQVSGLWSIPFSGGLSGVSSGPGVEAQIRYNPRLFSIGVGGEISWHDVTGTDRSVRLTGAFIEPRYVIQTSSESVAPLPFWADRSFANHLRGCRSAARCKSNEHGHRVHGQRRRGSDDRSRI